MTKNILLKTLRTDYAQPRAIVYFLYVLFSKKRMDEPMWAPKRLNTQSAGPVRFLIFCSISISLLANLVAGRRPRVMLV
jgi:hypothetical protein